MDRGAGDRDFATVTHRIIEPLAHGFRPEFILVSLGFDLYQHDRLGGMRVTPEGYGMLTARLIQMADRECRGRIAFVLEGGYSVKGIEACGLKFIQQLCKIDTGDSERSGSWSQRSPFVPSTISKVIDVHKVFWPQLI
jgi:acetoin utilization deacetylase AcuC-like enzyme